MKPGATLGLSHGFLLGYLGEYIYIHLCIFMYVYICISHGFLLGYLSEFIYIYTYIFIYVYVYIHGLSHGLLLEYLVININTCIYICIFYVYVCMETLSTCEVCKRYLLI
jgi:hypothetical protein